MNLNSDQETLESCASKCCQSMVKDGREIHSESVDNMGPLSNVDLQLFTVVEVSHFLGLGRSKVYELLYSGELKSVKIGGSRRIRYSDLGEFVRYLDDAS
jgi:excisionase family DNA binding protein